MRSVHLQFGARSTPRPHPPWRSCGPRRSKTSPRRSHLSRPPSRRISEGISRSVTYLRLDCIGDRRHRETDRGGCSESIRVDSSWQTCIHCGGQVARPRRPRCRPSEANWLDRRHGCCQRLPRTADQEAGCSFRRCQVCSTTGTQGDTGSRQEDVERPSRDLIPKEMPSSG